MFLTLLFIILLTLVTGVGGLALGGGLASLFKRESPRGASLLLSFTAGLMLCIVSFDMLPEAIEATAFQAGKQITVVLLNRTAQPIDLYLRMQDTCAPLILAPQSIATGVISLD